MPDPLRLGAGKVFINAADGPWQEIGTADGFAFSPAPEKHPAPPAATTFEVAGTIWMSPECAEHFQRLHQQVVEAARRTEEAVFAEALEKGWGVLQVGFWDVDSRRDPEDHVYHGGIRSLATPLIPAGSRWYFHDIATARRALRLDDGEDFGAS